MTNTMSIGEDDCIRISVDVDYWFGLVASTNKLIVICCGRDEVCLATFGLSYAYTFALSGIFDECVCDLFLCVCVCLQS